METREEKLVRLGALRKIAKERGDAAVEQEVVDAQREVSQAERARTDFVAFCEYVLKDEATGGSIKLAPVHLMWIQFMALCWSLDLFPYILAPYGTGKCQPASQRVLLANGAWVRIVDLSGRDARVMAYDAQTGAFCPAAARGAPNGRRTVRRLTTWSGRVLEVTEQHPVWTPAGWVAAGTLEVGAWMAVAREVVPAESAALRPGEAELLGYFVGDGCTAANGSSCASNVTSGDPETRARVCAVAAELGFTAAERTYPKRTPRVVVNGGARAWLRAHGLAGGDAHTKRTPPAIFTAPTTDVAAYLGAYVTCDGTVCRKNRAVELYSVNEGLVRDAQHLFSRLGIVARLRRKRGRYLGEVHWSWRLVISGQANLQRLAEAVPLCGTKRRALEAAMRPFGTPTDGRAPLRSGDNFDVIPNAAYRPLLQRTAWWHKHHTGVSLDQQSRYGTSRTVVRRAAEAEGNAALLRLCDAHTFWDRVVAVEDLGGQETYALEVDGYQSYVTEDVVVHNTTLPGIALPLYLLGQNPLMRIKIISSKDEIATERVELIRQYIDESEEYHNVFPEIRRDKKKKWTAHKLYVERGTRAKDASVEAIGATASKIGSRSDFNVYDDLNDMKNTILQPKLRKQVWKNYTGVFHNRLEPKARRGVGVMTRWHVEDVYGMITADPRMARQYGFLIQAVNEDLTALDCEIILGKSPTGLPIKPRALRTNLEACLMNYEQGLLAA
jgi:hypothetical protein